MTPGSNHSFLALATLDYVTYRHEWADENTTKNRYFEPSNEISIGRMSVGAGLRYYL